MSSARPNASVAPVMVELRGVTKRFGQVRAVDQVSLTIQAGEFFTLLGPSGCGKTTLLRLLAGLERPDEGEMWIAGRPVFSWKDGLFVPPARRPVGMVFQNFALWPHMTVSENVAFGLQARRVPNAECQDAVRTVLQLLQLHGLEDRFPHELSGGQQQRVALARALVTRPRLLLMDEPLSNLDANLRSAMRAELKRLHRESGATTVYVTHDQLEALTLSDRVAVLRDGRILQVAPPRVVYERPATLFVALFVAPALNVLEGTVEESPRPGIHAGPFFIPGRVAAAGGSRVLVTIRPEAWRIGPGGAPAAVEQVQFAGPETFIIARADSVTVQARLGADADWVGTDHILLAPDPRRVNVFDPQTEAALEFQPEGVPSGT